MLQVQRAGCSRRYTWQTAGVAGRSYGCSVPHETARRRRGARKCGIPLAGGRAAAGTAGEGSGGQGVRGPAGAPCAGRMASPQGLNGGTHERGSVCKVAPAPLRRRARAGATCGRAGTCRPPVFAPGGTAHALCKATPRLPPQGAVHRQWHRSVCALGGGLPSTAGFRGGDAHSSPAAKSCGGGGDWVDVKRFDPPPASGPPIGRGQRQAEDRWWRGVSRVGATAPIRRRSRRPDSQES